MNKKFLSGTLAVGILLSSVGVFADSNSELKPTKVVDPIKLTETKEEKNTINLEGIETYEKNGKLMVPLRELAEGQLGLKVVWNGENKSVEVGDGPQHTIVYIGKDSYYRQRMAPEELGAAPEVKDGVTYVPVEFFTEILLVEIEDSVDKKFNTLEGNIKQVNKFENDYSILMEDVKMGDYLVRIYEDTKIYAKDGKEIEAKDLKAGYRVQAETSMVSTLSLPPQTNAFKIKVVDDRLSFETKIDSGIKYPLISGVDKKVNEEIKKFVDETKEAYKDESVYKNLKLDHSMETLTEDMVSIKFYGTVEFNGKEVFLTRSLNLDKDGKRLNFNNYFKNDEASKKKLEEKIAEAVKEQYSMEYEAEGKEIYFSRDNIVVYYYPLDDSVEYPVTVYIEREEVKDLIK